MILLTSFVVAAWGRFFHGITTQIKVGSGKDGDESSKLIIVVNVVQHF